MDYKKLKKTELLKQFEIEKKKFNSLPRRDSFSGLAISDRCNRIQQEMFRRGYDFKPFYMEIDIEVG